MTILVIGKLEFSDLRLSKQNTALYSSPHFNALNQMWNTEFVSSYCRHLVDGMGSLFLKTTGPAGTCRE